MPVNTQNQYAPHEDRAIPASYADRAATPEEVEMARVSVLQADLKDVPRPVVAFISAVDIRMLFAARTSPDGFMQCVLAALKDAGAPVEGTLKLRLAHGAVARVKPGPQDEGGFRYMWLHEQYVAVIAKGGL